MTLSAKNLVEKGKTRPHNRLMAISMKPISKSVLLGRSKAQISGSAFQVSAMLFFGLAAGLSAAITGVATAAVGCVDIPSRLPGYAGILIGCGDLSFDYTPQVALRVRQCSAFFAEIITIKPSQIR